MPYDFIHMWNLRNETDEHGGGKKREGQTIKQTPTTENKQGWLLEGRGGWFGW